MIISLIDNIHDNLPVIANIRDNLPVIANIHDYLPVIPNINDKLPSKIKLLHQLAAVSLLVLIAYIPEGLPALPHGVGLVGIHAGPVVGRVSSDSPSRPPS